MRKLFLVVPCYNEAAMLPLSVPRMLEVLDDVESEYGNELETSLILADDGSTDDTLKVVGTFKDRRGRHLPLAHSGQQGALLGGLEFFPIRGSETLRLHLVYFNREGALNCVFAGLGLNLDLK